MRLTISALFLVISATIAHASNPCDLALDAQANATGIPSSLAAALSSSLAIGPNGKMYPYAVYVDGKTSIEKDPESAYRLIRSYLSRGASDVRAGCLGVSVTSDHDPSFIRQALDPKWNVENSLAGINSTVKQTDIGAPLAAIANSDAPLPFVDVADIPKKDPTFSSFDNFDDSPKDLTVGRERKSAAPGTFKSTWGLFTDRQPIPLTNP